jgi:hypothetical protein
VITTAARLVFGTGGNALSHQKQGWAAPEKGGTWCIGQKAELVLPLVPGEGDLLLEFILNPFAYPPFLVRQKLEVMANGTKIGETMVQGDSAVAFRVARELLGAAREVRVTLVCPNAARPADLRASDDGRLLGFQVQEMMAIWVPPETPVYPRTLPPLPFPPGDPVVQMAPSVAAITGLAMGDLMMQFESLGHNCEFGLLQRRCGAEPLGLLRFVGISVRELLIGLDYGFEGVDDPELTRVYHGGDVELEWMVRNDRYIMEAHTFRDPESVSAETVMAEELAKIRFKRRRFLEVLETGEKLFVFQRQEPMSEAQALPILNLLRSHGRNALLFVSGTAERPCGSVDRLAVDLYRGNIDKLAPIGAADKLNLPAWISICANAYRLWRESGLGA